MSENPKISIVTVCFNAAKYIGDNIASVNYQDYSNIEHIFIDGLSTDDTVRIIKNMAGEDYKLISEPDLGIYNAMNKGIELAIRLKEDLAFYEQCSRETRRLFEQKYSEKVFVEKTMKILESL